MWWPQTKKPITAMAMLRPGDEFVAEHVLRAKSRDDLADHAHARQDHDVDGGMRVEPEQVLEQQRIAAQRRIEYADAEDALDSPAAAASSPARASPAPGSRWWHTATR